ncbi:LptE family protein [uncultured Lacinutrix sp.]|uniref:LptE family protein n=1 Tax=uncultured Lacinutrix sp. TaxID=574032 RepID=UPI00261775C7|nr:LptE family protein [uncultured Lacinutrix sp.]
MKYIKYILILAITTTLISCGSYSFTGYKPSNAKTYQVNYFQNTAQLIEPGLERDFTLALQDLIQNQSNLELVTSNGDMVYEGEITEYRISPTTATANNTAAQNRLSISVNLRYFNKTKEDSDIEKRFSFFYDFAGSAVLSGSVKATAHDEIFERLTQDIFNATLADW